MAAIRRLIYIILMLVLPVGGMLIMSTVTSGIASEVLATLVAVLLVLISSFWMLFWMMCAVWDKPPGIIASGLGDALGSLFWSG